MPPPSQCYRQDMSQTVTMWWRQARWAAAAALLLGASDLARAEPVCVVCSGPDAVYRCQAGNSALKAGDARLGLACITEIARRDGHQSCSVNRRLTNCEGPERTISLTSATPAAETLPAAAPAPPAPAKSEQEPPDTVAELAKRTAESSKQQLDKATDAVGDAAKKTGGVVSDVARKTGGAVGDMAKKSWRCLSSLFSEC